MGDRWTTPAGPSHGLIVNGPLAPDTIAEFRARTRPRPRAHTSTGNGWYRIANNGTRTGVAEIYLYDEIGMWGVTAQMFVDELKQITAPTIELHINSPGGEVFDGQAIYSSLKAHPAFVHVMVDGLAASAASFIAQAGDKVTIARNGMMMIHNAGGLCWGNARDMRQMADLLDKLDANIADIYKQRAGGTLDDWRAAMDAETWYTGAEAVAAGLADEMTDPDEDEAAPEEMRAAWDLSMFRYAGREAAPAPAAVRGQAPAPGDGGAVEPPPAPAACVVCADTTDVHPSPHTTNPVCRDAIACVERDDAAAPAASPVAGDEPVDPTRTVEQQADRDWLDITGHLGDEWAALVAALTEDPGPSTVDDPLARLREAP